MIECLVSKTFSFHLFLINSPAVKSDHTWAWWLILLPTVLFFNELMQCLKLLILFNLEESGNVIFVSYLMQIKGDSWEMKTPF